MSWQAGTGWLLLLATPLCVVAGLRYLEGTKRPPGPIDRAVLMLVFLPLMHLGATWAGFLEAHFLRFEHQWLAWLPSACGLLVWLLRRAPGATDLQRQLTTAAIVLGSSCAAAAVAAPEWGRPSDRVAVVVAIDRSRSTALVQDVDARVEAELQAAKTSMRQEDLLATVVFGANAVVRSPAVPKHVAAPAQVASVIPDATDIEAALRRALAETPAQAAGKIVLLSDGVQTRGDAFAGVAAAVAAGVPIDVVPLDQRKLKNVRLVKLSAPTSVSQGEVYELRVVVEAPQAATLTLRELQDEQFVRQTPVSVGPGRTLLSLRQSAQDPGLHRIQIQVAADDPELDRLPEDNQLARFVRVRGRSRVLLLTAGESSSLEGILSNAGLEVSVVSPPQTPTSAADFSQYDLVVLENAPASAFSDEQLTAMASFVRVAGGGLLLLGSPTTLGPGGYARTPIESVSPVAFDLKQDRYRGQLSEVIAIDYSGSMGAHVAGVTKLELANEGAVRSLQLLGESDRLGVAHVDTEASWTIPLSPVINKPRLAERIRQVGPGGGGIALAPALRAAYSALTHERSALKHVLLFADGSDVQGNPGALSLVAEALRSGVTTSVVALGRGQDLPLLEQVSQAGRGRFYVVNDASRLPAVFAQETVTASRAALVEEAFTVTQRASSPITRGIDFGTAPPLAGYVVTLARPRASVLLSGPDGDPILATWSSGLGQCATFASDYGSTWGKTWASWPEGAQLFIQLARSLARNEETARVRLDAGIDDGRLRVNIDALTDAGGIDELRTLQALLAGPDGRVETLELRAAGAGRYSASQQLQRPGAYLVSVQDKVTGELVATTGVELSSGDELKSTGTDRAILRRIAEESGGQVRETLAGLFEDRLEARWSFTKLTPQLAWLSAAMLLVSVALRRVRVRLPAWLLVAGSAPIETADPRVQRQPKGPPSSSLPDAESSPAPGSDEPVQKTSAEVLLERRRRAKQEAER